MVTNVLDQAQVADAINRQKVGSQRVKNEMMRQGTQDPGSFSMNNQQEIQQAQQPSEFWGAGRRELTAGTDQSLLGALGGSTTKLGGQDFYYSPYDISKASWGTMDADDVDLGKGQYSIMSGGKALGTGYKSLADTLKDYGQGGYATGNATRDWETLGQQLNYGGVTGDFSSPHALGGNKKADLISGLNTLYGSKPIVYDGKILGYNSPTGVDPIKDQWNQQSTNTSKSGGLFNKKITTTHNWDMGNVGMGRQSVDPTWLQKNAIGGGNGTYTIAPDKAAENPGWYNQDYYNRNVGQNSQTQKQGFLGGIFNILDPILDKLDPMHNKVQEWTTGSAERDQQQPYFSKIAPMIINGFFPGWGSALSAIDEASMGNGRGAVGNAAGAYLGMSGGFNTGYGNLANAAANSAAGGAINSFASGGDLADIFKAAALGAAGGAAGSGVSSATSGLNPALSGFLSGAAKGAVSGLAQPKSMFESALSSGAAGGLAGMFTPTNATPEQKRQASGTATDAVKLAKLFMKKK
jgi:hypothetical protein